ncbi:MAG: DUF1501 domain-containing protein [Phycisphaerales bacterium]|nr:DUF1501 domain-containing protein [Phycisphaerales bacterium]
MSKGVCGCAEYTALSRRGFMATAGSAAAVLASAPAWLPRVSYARDYRSSARDVMISIYLRGGADGLTMCVPWSESAYYAARPTLAVPRPDSGLATRVKDLDGFFGLPPALWPLLPAYTDGRLLIVHATGLTESNRSHFDAQRQMEVGVVGDTQIASGWLGRHLASVEPMLPGAMLRGVGLGAGVPRTLVGAPQTLPIPDLQGYGLTGRPESHVARATALQEMYAATGDPLRAAGVDTMRTISLLEEIDFAGYIPAGGAVYPDEKFAHSLKGAAALIKAEVGVEAIAIDIDGWDTHYDQGPTGGPMFNLMKVLADGLAAFYTDMTAVTAPSFVCAVLTEFGRRVAENGSVGTDHGHGGAMFLLGTAVQGGRVLTDWPGLVVGQLFEQRDLKITIDYRDILGEIVAERLGNPDLDAVFPGYTPTFRGVL